MTEALYERRPDVYDVLYASKEYDAEVEWVLDRFEKRTAGGDRALVVGCGTGEHSRRLVDRGFDVTGVDRYEAMVERARGKSEADFRVDALPELSVGGQYDLVWAPFTVVNHLAPDEFAPGVRSMADRVRSGGMLVVDTLGVADADSPHLSTYADAEGRVYGRLTQTRSVDDEDRRYSYDSLVFTPDGDVFADTHDYTNYDAQYVVGVLEGAGLETTVHDWYGHGHSSEAAAFVGVR